jgi:hypothetical protein
MQVQWMQSTAVCHVAAASGQCVCVQCWTGLAAAQVEVCVLCWTGLAAAQVKVCAMLDWASGSSGEGVCCVGPK